ncbi:MAG: hypothetical protein L6Q74_19135 [Sphaerotilus natans subsp. sulfidivorans]|uniref:DUF6985 domain-containing protein n=1 Tax=Sphaerotilus sulfidivorans TaxID=639200 RepID=UPI0023527220|nr:hypothetical protein [Sphaerotilus sulfidivorans]MCK6403995.1 hypothetical protein [Sphaerotilus sulfidivorans]
MQIPGLGYVERDAQFPEWSRSAPVALPLLNGAEVTVVVSEYEDDDRKQDFEVAIANLLRCPAAVLKQAEPYIFKYYEDVNSALWTPDDPEYLVIEGPEKVWGHIRIGKETMVMRRAYGDKAVYVSFECECDWESEHGLQIVLRSGNELVRVGSNDGQLTNSDAFGDDRLESVIYRGSVAQIHEQTP